MTPIRGEAVTTARFPDFRQEFSALQRHGAGQTPASAAESDEVERQVYMKRSLLASVLAAGLMTEAAGPIVAAQNAYPTQQQTVQQQHYAQQQYQQQYHKNHRDRNKRIKHGVIGGAIGAGAGALLGGGAGAAIGAAAGGATGALWPTHHHDH